MICYTINMFWDLIVILIGLGVGSFVNVLASRLVARKSIVFPRSFCDACAKPLWRRDMIPVVSFLLLRARCRFCQARISWQYPLVEAATAALFLAAAFVARTPVELALFWLAITVLITLFLTDLRAMVLPDFITLPSIAIFLIFDFTLLGRPPIPLLIAMAVGGGFFLVQYMFSAGKWVGSGDIRFGVLMGAILGSWPLVAQALIMSYIIGAAASIPLLLTKKKQWASEIPLGTFLAIGTLIVLFFVHIY